MGATDSPIFILQCDTCGEPANPERKDDVGTQWYSCRNGHTTATPIKRSYEPMTYKTFPSWCGDDGKFNPALLRDDIVSNYAIKTDVETDVCYFYDPNNGIYDKNGDMILRRIISNCLDLENRRNRTDETIFLIHAKTHEKLRRSKMLAVQNGLLNVETGEVIDFTPNEFVTIRLPVRYDSSVDCPEIRKFLNEVLSADIIPQVQEAIGYTLLQDMPFHASPILLGEGANGKSTLMDLITTFLGRENVSHVTLQQMCEGKFELAQLDGKLANLCDDLPSNSLKAVGPFKTLTGNAPILAQHKHKNPFEFWNTAKSWWACNKLPKPSEDTVAFFRRFLIWPFNRFFIGDRCDLDKLKKLTTPDELSGLLNYALAGLKRLQQNKKFTNALSVEETRQQYIRSADSCTAFIEEYIEASPEPRDFIVKDELYRAYVKWCKDYRLPKVEDVARLTRAMKQALPDAENTAQRIDGKAVKVWQYCKFVSTVSTVTTISILAEFQDSNSKNKKTPVTPETVVTDSLIEQHVCGHCALWHRSGCTFPDAEYTCVTPTNIYAIDCKEFIERERSQ